MGRLDGRVAIITGAGFGIGRGIARRFARESAAVTVAEINIPAGEHTAGEVDALGGRGLFVATDVTDKAQCQAAIDVTVARFGRIDILVNNAWGGGTITPCRFKCGKAACIIQKRERNPRRTPCSMSSSVLCSRRFLASDDARYLTGNTLFVDGGSHINGVQWDPGLPED